MMVRCAALYSKPPRPVVARARVELDGDELIVIRPDGRWRRLSLHGSSFEVLDAACESRFVRHLMLSWPRLREHLITPPDRGAIAPRAAGVPRAPEDAAIVESPTWRAVATWVRGRGRFGAFGIAELAQIALAATPVFANEIGAVAASIAQQTVWERSGPLRGGAGVADVLRPLAEAARGSERAAAALAAATAYLRDRNRSRTPQLRRGLRLRGRRSR